MLMETTGESYMNYLGDPSNWNQNNNHKSLGASAMDMNRLPKLIYTVWKNGLWIPYSQRPGVALQSHWNYAAGNRTVTAYSNCPGVELFINGSSKGVKTPNTKTSKCEWTNIAWESGTLRAEGKDAAGKTVCSDERKTAGTPHHIVLTVDAPIVKPDGSAFKITANGVDAGFVLATIVDSAGNWCPLSNHNITFTASGPGTYLGSANFEVDLTKPSESYHAPGDKELMAEGGQMKIAVRSTYTPGTITVSASAAGLISGSTSFQTYPVDDVTAISSRLGAFPGSQVIPQTRTFRVIGKTFSLPAQYAGKKVALKVYDLSGKLLTQTIVKDKRINLRRLGIGAGTCIVRCSEIANAVN
jgi:beta-galactosidase